MTEQPKPNIISISVQLLLVVVIAPFLPMIISGDWSWRQGWAFATVTILSFIVSRAIARHYHPDLLRERARFMEAKDTKPWDKVLAPMLGIGSILIPIAAGIDHLSDGTSAFPLWVSGLSLAGLVFGYGFSAWAMIVNRFFSGTVRIQTERGHHVVHQGPYRIMRHPGYAGALFGYVLIPLLLDSL